MSADRMNICPVTHTNTTGTQINKWKQSSTFNMGNWTTYSLETHTHTQEEKEVAAKKVGEEWALSKQH